MKAARMHEYGKALVLEDVPVPDLQPDEILVQVTACVFFVEALHPYEVLTAEGFEVDLASETGTCGFDDVSLTSPFLSGSDHAILNNPKHPFMVKIKSQLKKASDLKKEDYGFFFASAGHSALYDYRTAKGLQAISADIWERGGIVGTVCHGPAIMPGIIDSKTGKSIIHGKTVT